MPSPRKTTAARIQASQRLLGVTAGGCRSTPEPWDDLMPPRHIPLTMFSYEPPRYSATARHEAAFVEIHKPGYNRPHCSLYDRPWRNRVGDAMWLLRSRRANTPAPSLVVRVAGVRRKYPGHFFVFSTSPIEYSRDGCAGGVNLDGWASTRSSVGARPHQSETDSPTRSLRSKNELIIIVRPLPSPRTAGGPRRIYGPKASTVRCTNTQVSAVSSGVAALPHEVGEAARAGEKIAVFNELGKA